MPPAANGPPAISGDSWLSSLILGLDPSTSVTGDTYLCFGLLAFLSPINSTHLIPIPQRSRPDLCPKTQQRRPDLRPAFPNNQQSRLGLVLKIS